MRITDSAATRGKMRRTLRGWLWLGLPLLLLASPHATAQQEIRFGVLGLFHPRELILQPEGSQVLLVAAQGDAGNPALVLNGEPGHRQIVFRAEGDRVVAGDRSASSWTAAARDNGAVAFRLTVPGKFHRVYCARLAIQARKGQLLAVVAMDRETAVASIVAAEMAESSPMEALKAQKQGGWQSTPLVYLENVEQELYRILKLDDTDNICHSLQEGMVQVGFIGMQDASEGILFTFALNDGLLTNGVVAKRFVVNASDWLATESKNLCARKGLPAPIVHDPIPTKQPPRRKTSLILLFVLLIIVLMIVAVVYRYR